jgi:glycosyltransferase involved in cell wall biosynthesis
VNVLFVTASYPTANSPVAGVFVREHALAAATRADVAVLHLERDGSMRGIGGAERVDSEDLPTWRVRYGAKPSFVSALMSVVAARRGLRAVRRAGFEPDVVHAHFFLAGAPAALLGKPLVVTEQWSIFLPESPQQLTPLLRAAARFAYGRARLVLPVSNALRHGIEATGAHPPFRIVPNVVDTSLFTPGDGPRNGRLLTVGLFVDAKGYEYLFEALALLEHPVAVDVVGDGAKRTEYEQLVQQLGMTDRVAFHGILSKPEVARRMREAELFVLTSRYDNNPCVVIEALASGLPVVATAVGGIPEMVDPTSGRLATPRDSKSIANEIAGALADIDRFDRAEIAAAAKRRYSREHIGETLAQAYAEVRA